MSSTDARSVPVIAMDRERFTLDSGVRLIVHRRPGAQVTSIRVHVEGGPVLDPKGKEGLAHYVGALADQGTESRSDEDIARLLEPEGGGVRGDSLGLFGSVAGGGWRVLVDVLGDLVQRATYPGDRVARQMTRMSTRLEVERDDPRAQAGILFRRLVFGQESHLGRATYGDLDSVQAIETADLLRHRQEHWCGSRLIVVVVGDIDPAEARAEVERAFGEIPRGTPHRFVLPEVPTRSRRTDSFVRDRNQTHVQLGHVGITRSDPDYAALVVMDHVLGTGPGFTNRITRILRDELGLAYTVHADISGSAGRNPGVFRAYIGTSPEHVETAVEGFLREMRRIQEEPVPTEELDVAKSYLVGSFAMGFERSAQRANYLVGAEVHGFADDQLQALAREFAAVTQDDVQRVAQKHLFPDACCIVTSGSEPQSS